MPTILVDADSMPQSMRSVILRRAVRENIPTVFAADRDLADVREAVREHTIALRAPLRGVMDKSEIRKVKSTVQMLVVESGQDAADDALVELSGPTCLVVSHDIPLLARAIEKGATGLDDRGNIYTRENIAPRLSQRNNNRILREMGIFEEHEGAMDRRVLSSFANAFDRQLALMEKSGL